MPTINVRPRHRNCPGAHQGTPDPVPQLCRRGFLLRGCHLVARPCPLGDQPDRSRPEERWSPLRSHCPVHDPSVGRRVPRDLPLLPLCEEARRPRVRHHPLSSLTSDEQDEYTQECDDRNQYVLLIPSIRILYFGDAYRRW